MATEFKYILIPEPLQTDSGAFSFETYMVMLVNLDPRLNDGSNALRASMRIDNAVTDANQKGQWWIRVRVEDWKILQECVNDPKFRQQGTMEVSTAYPFQPARKMLSFIDAVSEAKDEKPKKPPAWWADALKKREEAKKAIEEEKAQAQGESSSEADEETTEETPAGRRSRGARPEPPAPPPVNRQPPPKREKKDEESDVD